MKLDSGKCFSICKIPVLFKLDTLDVIDVPAKLKTVRIPETYFVSIDTVVDESKTIIKKIPPAYEAHYDAYQNLKVTKNYKSTTPDFFILHQENKVIYNKKLVKQASIEQILLPPLYETVFTRQIIKSEHEEQTVEVLCNEELNTELILTIKDRLKVRGYRVDEGSIDIGKITMNSLEKFQEDNNLPIGGLNIISLQFLGVL